MTEPFAIVLSALIGGLFATAANLVAGVLSRRKTNSESKKLDADAAQTVSEAALSLVQPLTDKIERLEKQVAAQQQTIDIQQNTINDLQASMKLMQADSLAKDKAFQDVVVRVRVLETALCEAETEIHELIDGANVLADQVVELGEEPRYKPPARRPKVSA